MEMLLQVPVSPDQPPRTVVVHAVHADDTVTVQARDGAKPALWQVKPSDFPWRQCIDALLVQWQLSRPVPAEFKPRRRIADEVLAALSIAEPADIRRILLALRTAGTLPALAKAEYNARVPATRSSAPNRPNSPPTPRRPARGDKGPEWG